MGILDLLSQPWPWYVAGPLIGLTVPLLLVLGQRAFGISSSLRHLCAVVAPKGIRFFDYDWRREGGWNLVFVLGIFLGGAVAGLWLANPEPPALSSATVRDLQALGVPPDGNLLPASLFSWESLLTARGLIMLVLGGFLVGFGARWAAGCTSGHAITGLSNLQLPSLQAVIGFFMGGLLVTHLVLPWLLAL